MSSPFAAAIAVAAATSDAIMGESFDYTPMKGVDDLNSRPVADPGRATVSGLVAIWGDATARAHSGPVHTPAVTAERPGHASSRPYISLDLSRLPYRPAKGDRLKRLTTMATYQVAEVVPSTPGLARLDLNLISGG